MLVRLAGAELFVLTFVSFALVSCLPFWVAAPAALAHLRSWAPARRHVALGLLGAGPLLTACALFAASVAPALASLMDPALDHCLAHDDGHAHLCFVHAPPTPPHAALWICVALVSTLLLVQATMLCARTLRGARIVRALARTGVGSFEGSGIVLEHPAATCIAAGLLRPQILISRGLLAVLTGAQRKALFAHERSHARRRDALVRLIAGVLSRVYPSRIRSALLYELDVAAEQVCDEAAAQDVGDRVVVADAILVVERETARMPLRVPALVALSMTQLAIAARVEALLEEPRTGGKPRTVLALLAAALLALSTGADGLHHLVESLLSPLLH